MPAGEFKTELFPHVDTQWVGHNKTDRRNQSSGQSFVNRPYFVEWSVIFDVAQ